MKTGKLRMTAAAAAAMLLLGGCGAKPYELTEREMDIITDYSAHIVAKYNVMQKDGLAYVDDTEAGDADVPGGEPQEPVTENSDESGENTSEDTGGEPSEGGGPDSSQVQKTLDELFGMNGISISYQGARLIENGMQDSGYALNITPGKVYLALDVMITNSGGSDAAFDILARAPKFKVTVNGDISAQAELTFLLEDFSTYQETVAAGTSSASVLLFQIPESVKEVNSLTLETEVDGTGYQIIL